MIDEETERAVERWVQLGDQVAGREKIDERASCVHCGSRERLLSRGKAALCAHCYLESGEPSEE